MNCEYCVANFGLLMDLESQGDCFVCDNCGSAYTIEYLGWYKEGSCDLIEDGSYPSKEDVNKTGRFL